MTTDTNSKIDEIRKKMRNLRGSMVIQRADISAEIQDLKQTAFKAVDLKHQLFSHPILASMMAGAVGFFLIPRKSKASESTDPKSVEKLIAGLREKFNIPAESASKTDSVSWGTKAFNFMKGYATQMVISQAKRRLISFFADFTLRSNRAKTASCDDFENSQCESYPLHPHK